MLKKSMILILPVFCLALTTSPVFLSYGASSAPASETYDAAAEKDAQAANEQAAEQNSYPADDHDTALDSHPANNQNANQDSPPASSDAADDPLTDFSANDWRLILVNKQHPIPDDYEFELGSIHNGLKVDKRITRQLDQMLSAARQDGINLLVISPYRDPARQKELFDKKIKRALRQDQNYLNAYKETASAVTIPGSSEHEIGLAVDITTKQHITLDEQYADSEGGIWLKQHCMLYGFILRYPDGKEDITGIEFEPWHFRYVGKDAATYITKHDLTLEEFVAMMQGS